MTTETLVTSGQTDTATASSQPAPGATDTTTGAQPDANQQQASTETEGQPAEGTEDKGAADDKSGDADKPTGAPEQYEDFTAPEGVTLDAEVTGEFKALAKELNLPQDQAQKIADLGAKLAQKWEAKHAAALAETAAKWATDSKADKEFGGDKLPENMATAKKALDTFGSPELKTLLNTSGLGNHPEIIRLLFKTGAAISEDRLVAGKPGTTPAVSTAQRMFPNMNP